MSLSRIGARLETLSCQWARVDRSWLTGGKFRFVGIPLDARSGTLTRLGSWRGFASGLGRESFAKETGFSPLEAFFSPWLALTGSQPQYTTPSRQKGS